MRDVQAPMQQSKLQNYNSQRGAASYKGDYQNKLHRKLSDKRERALLHRYFAEIGHCGRILDLPCGHGRLSDFLASRCDQLLEADWSYTMVDLNRNDHQEQAGRGYLRCSALEIPLPDRSIDCVVSFRLSHHLESQELREQHLRELFRVADKAVVVTWFSATSMKNLLRQVRVKLAGRKPKNTLHNARVREVAQANGFGQHFAKPLFLIGSGHQLGLFLRREHVATMPR